MGVVLIDKYAESEYKELTHRLKFQWFILSCLTHVWHAVENCKKDLFLEENFCRLRPISVELSKFFSGVKTEKYIFRKFT